MGLVETGRACLACRLSDHGSGTTGVLSRWTLGVADADVDFGAIFRRFDFEESALTHFTLGLGSGSAGFLYELARRAFDVGSAGVGDIAADRHVGFEESVWTRFTIGLGGGSAGFLCVLARWTRDMGGAL